ncbi:putative UDP-glucuronate:xylan alpha-glucuronosyltransferase 5 [Macadamia integrifolia]|uniref:putative UDP-glucuronate:xylan alpha-glucuronosyltransferase 5 n=1 Tax=Macadamia integrifolia TaxID=60698 RepID=UPI001C4EA526|nr:putative UDP-glucuronate:xylan alpha-glucuronosyltransferase 5 [Macadamia integrifolia]
MVLQGRSIEAYSKTWEAEMASKSKGSGLKFKLFAISLLSLSLSLLILTSTFLQKNHHIVVHHLQNRFPGEMTNWAMDIPIEVPKKLFPPYDFIAKVFKRDAKIGLVNIEEGEEGEEWAALGRTTVVRLDQVQEEIQWEDLFPEWIDEEEKWKKPSCPEIPMPRYKDYEDQFDVVVAKVPCGNGVQKQGQGIRDVSRLQVNLVVADLVVRSGRRYYDHREDRMVYVIFIGSCGPMWEIFRCDDLLIHEGNSWIYRPNLRRLLQKVLMPVGSCKLALPQMIQGEGRVDHDFSNLYNPIEQPRDAYVTILHSSEAYVCGAIALAQSIIQTGSSKDLVLLADQSITKKTRQALRKSGWKIKNIKRIRNPLGRKNAYNEWNYSKFRLWQLVEYDKVIFIDSDSIVFKNMDEFFGSPELSAVGNDKFRFNSGIMLIEPSMCVFKSLMKKRHTLVSYNGGDQGFLNEAFTWWHRWPARLNYLKVFNGSRWKENTKHDQVLENVYGVHYLGLKPWTCYRDYDCNWDRLDHQRFASDLVHSWWWKVYDGMPKRLQKYCGLTERMDARINKWRSRARIGNLSNGHWQIQVKDPRQRL